MDKDLGVFEEGIGGAKKEEVGDGADGGGLRYNKGKNLLELLPPEWEMALGDVMTQGSKKYDARNWEQGMKWSSMIGCLKRHVNKFLAGERYDGKEFDLDRGTTGCHHLAMVAWNALALMSYDLREIGDNDLPDLQLELFERVNAGTSDMGEEVNPKPPVPSTAFDQAAALMTVDDLMIQAGEVVSMTTEGHDG